MKLAGTKSNPAMMVRADSKLTPGREDGDGPVMTYMEELERWLRG